MLRKYIYSIIKIVLTFLVGLYFDFIIKVNIISPLSLSYIYSKEKKIQLYV